MRPTFRPLLTIACLLAGVSAGAQTPTEVLRAGLTPGEFKQTEKLSGELRALAADSLKRVGKPVKASEVPYSGAEFGAVFQTIDERAVVDITVIGRAAQEVAAEAARLPGVTVLGVAQTDSYGVVSLAAPAEQLVGLAGISGATGLSGASSSTSGQGAAQSEAAEVLSLERMLDYYPGTTGAGVTLGILSDSVNRVDGIPGGAMGIAESQASGDLPASNRIQVLNDFTGAGATDEGRAMMELVYDLAPGIDLYGFATAFGGEATFANNITALRNAGYDIIVDDVAYSADPIYQVGVIGAASQDYIDAGGIRFSSAGNSANNAIEFTLEDDDFTLSHDFDGSNEMAVTIQGGGRVQLVLQWAEAIGEVTRNLDLVLEDKASPFPPLATTTEYVNPVIQRPYDYLVYTNGGGSTINARLKVRIAPGNPTGVTCQLRDFRSTGVSYGWGGEPRCGTINGHASIPDTMAVGAAAASSPTILEGFSSVGPSRLHFDRNGNPYSPILTTTKPDLVCLDGITNSFFPNSASPVFFGTSAAAPNAAAIAALTVQLAKLRIPNPDQFDARYFLSSTAVDEGSPGWDNSWGAGRIDALCAAIAAKAPTPNTTSLYFDASGDCFEDVHLGFDGLVRVQRVASPVAGDFSFQIQGDGMEPVVLLIDPVNQDVVAVSSGPGAIKTISVPDGGAKLWWVAVASRTPFTTANYTFAHLGPTPPMTAVTLPLSTPLGTNGTINQSHETDYFEVTVPNAYGRVEANVTATFPCAIRWYDGAFELTEDLSNPANQPAILGYTHPRPNGKYHFAITPQDYSGTGSYTVSFRFYQDTVTGCPTVLSAPINVDGVVRPNPVTGQWTFQQNLAAGTSRRYAWSQMTSAATAPTSTGNINDLFTMGLYASTGERGYGYGPISSATLDPVGLTAGIQYIQYYAAQDGNGGGVNIGSTMNDVPPVFDMAFGYTGTGVVQTSTVTGALTNPAEGDYYVFGVPDNGLGTINVSVDPSGSANLAMDLYRENGVFLQSIDAGGNGVTESLAGFAPPTDATYAIVRASSASGNPSGWAYAGDYTFTVSGQTTGIPATITAPITTVDYIAYPDPATGNDLWGLQTQAGDVRHTLIRPKQTNLQLALSVGSLETCGLGIYTSATPPLNLGADGPAPSCGFPTGTLTANTAYYLRTASIYDDAFPGILQIASISNSPPTLETWSSTTTTSGLKTWTHSGTISLFGESDNFSFTLPANSRGNYFGRLDVSSALDGVVGFFDADGLPLEPNDVPIFFGPGQTIEFYTFPTGTTIYAQVRAAKQLNVPLNDASMTGAYTLTIQAPTTDGTPLPSPTTSPSPSPSATVSPSPSPSATPSATPSLTPTASATPSLTPSAVPSFTPTPSPTATLSPTASPTASPSQTATASPSATATPSLTAAPSPSATASPTNAPTPTTSPSPTAGPVTTELILSTLLGQSTLDPEQIAAGDKNGDGALDCADLLLSAEE